MRKKIKKIIEFISTFICSFITYLVALPLAAIIFFAGYLAKVLKLNGILTFLIRIWCQLFFSIIGIKLKAHGLEKVDKNKQYLIVANHASYYDIPAIMHFIPDLVWVANKRFFNVLIFGSFLKLMETIPVDPNNFKESKSAIEKISYRVGKTKTRSICIFPEGTRTMDGKIHNFKRGFLTILKYTNFDLLPVTLNGTYHVKPKWSFFIHWIPSVDVIFHDPIPHSNINFDDEKGTAAYIQDSNEKDYQLK